EADQDPLAPALDGADAPADEVALPQGAPAAAEGPLTDRDSGNPPADQVRPEVANDAFDFRQFGHRTPRREMATRWIISRSRASHHAGCIGLAPRLGRFYAGFSSQSQALSFAWRLSRAAMSSPAKSAADAGRFGPYGGQYVPETLMHALGQLTEQYRQAQDD